LEQPDQGDQHDQGYSDSRKGDPPGCAAESVIPNAPPDAEFEERKYPSASNPSGELDQREVAVPFTAGIKDETAEHGSADEIARDEKLNSEKGKSERQWRCGGPFALSAPTASELSSKKFPLPGVGCDERLDPWSQDRPKKNTPRAFSTMEHGSNLFM